MKTFIVTYTREIPSAMYRYIADSKRVEIVFKDRNRVISYPVTSRRGEAILRSLVTKGKVHTTVCKAAYTREGMKQLGLFNE